LHKLSTGLVRENPEISFTFERLTGIRSNGNKKRHEASNIPE
jgi:hypothetical protein